MIVKIQTPYRLTRLKRAAQQTRKEIQSIKNSPFLDAEEKAKLITWQIDNYKSTVRLEITFETYL